MVAKTCTIMGHMPFHTASCAVRANIAAVHFVRTIVKKHLDLEK
jgi:hypothetical protein